MQSSAEEAPKVGENVCPPIVLNSCSGDQTIYQQYFPEQFIKQPWQIEQ